MRLTGLLLCLCLVACEAKAAEPARSDFEQRADAATIVLGDLRGAFVVEDM